MEELCFTILQKLNGYVIKILKKVSEELLWFLPPSDVSWKVIIDFFVNICTFLCSLPGSGSLK